MHTSLRSVFLLVVTSFAITLMVWAAACSDEPAPAPTATAPAPTATSVVPAPSPTQAGVGSIAEARERLADSGQSLAVVDAAMAGDIDALLRAVAFADAVCAAPTDHGDPPLCEPLGLAPGTAVRVAPVGAVLPVPVPEEYLRRYFESALADGTARLAFAGTVGERAVVGIAFAAIGRPLEGLGSDRFAAFVFEIDPAGEPPITRTFILSEGAAPRAAVAEVYSDPPVEVWYAE